MENGIVQFNKTDIFELSVPYLFYIQFRAVIMIIIHRVDKGLFLVDYKYALA